MTSPLDRIADLATLLSAAGIDELHLTGPGGLVRLRRAGAAGEPGRSRPAASPEASGAADETVPSSGVGRFLRGHPLRDEPLVEVGQTVAAGQTIGLLQIGPVLRPVSAPRAGIVASVAAAEATLVGYGDPLARLRPAG